MSKFIRTPEGSYVYAKDIAVASTMIDDDVPCVRLFLRHRSGSFLFRAETLDKAKQAVDDIVRQLEGGDPVVAPDRTGEIRALPTDAIFIAGDVPYGALGEEWQGWRQSHGELLKACEEALPLLLKLGNPISDYDTLHRMREAITRARRVATF